MRSLAADAALVTVPAAAATGVAAYLIHSYVASLSIMDGQWFARSMLAIPFYAGAAAALTHWVTEWAAGWIRNGAMSIDSAARWIAGAGCIAALVGLAVHPSIFVATAASTIGTCLTLRAHSAGRRKADDQLRRSQREASPAPEA